MKYIFLIGLVIYTVISIILIIKGVSNILNRDIEIEAEAYFHTYLMQECLRVLRGEK